MLLSPATLDPTTEQKIAVATQAAVVAVSPIVAAKLRPVSAKLCFVSVLLPSVPASAQKGLLQAERRPLDALLATAVALCASGAAPAGFLAVRSAPVVAALAHVSLARLGDPRSVDYYVLVSVVCRLALSDQFP